MKNLILKADIENDITLIIYIYDTKKSIVIDIFKYHIRPYNDILKYKELRDFIEFLTNIEKKYGLDQIANFNEDISYFFNLIEQNN